MNRILLSAFALLLALPAAAAPEPEKTAIELREQALQGKSAGYDFVRDLTTLIGPRPAGSAAEQAAAAWAADRLKALGFEQVRIETFPMTGWVRGTERAELLGPQPQNLAAASLGGGPATPAAGLEADVVMFATLDELMAQPKGALAGKIAMVNRRTTRTQTGQGYGVSGRARAQGPVEAADRGAVGFLLRSIGTDSNRMPHTGATRFRDGKVPVPAFALSNPDADQIERLVAMGKPVRVRLFSGAKLVPDVNSQNVIAEIRGREKPDEIVLLGAHLDSWDLGTGAIDDAAGAGILVGAAKLIGDLPQHPRRTIRVVLYGAEEVTQPDDRPMGGRSYLDKHRGEIPGHVLAGESDVGADRIYALSLPDGVAASPFGQSVLRVLAPLGILPSRDPPGRAGVDVAPVVDAGVPALVLHQDASRYFDLHHTADDTFDKIDKAQFEQNVAAWASLAWLAAETDTDFRKLAPAPAPAARSQ